MVKATTIVVGIALALAGASAAAQPADTFTPARAAGYSEVTDWPDFTGVWSPDWAYLFASRGARRATAPVLTPEAQTKYDAFLEQQQREGVNQYLQANCIPPGMPNIMRQPYPVEFLFSPDRVTLLTETYSQARRLYLDGRALPDDPEPLFNGTSVGRWEGNMLVVDTVGFNHLVTYQSGIEPSQKMRIHEHFWLAEPDVMMVETTITDPGVLAEPMVQLQAFRRKADWDIREYVCEEDNRLTDDEGGANIDLGFDDPENDPFGPPPEE